MRALVGGVLFAVLAVCGLMAQAPSVAPSGPAQPATQQTPPKQGQQPAGPPPDQPLIIDAAVTPNQPELVLLLDSSGLASFGIVRRVADRKTPFTLSISNLLDAQGQPSSAVLIVENRADSDVQENLTAPSGVLRVGLRVTPPRPASRLSGTLMLLTATSSVIWRVHLQPAVERLAVLAVDTPVQTLRLTRYWLRPNATPSDREFSVRVYDKSRTSALEGVWVRVDPATRAADGFNLARDVTFTFNKKSADLLSPSDAAARYVPPGAQGLVRGTITGDLRPGEYNVALRFGASNSVDDEAQKMTLAMFVKDGPWPALLVLLAAVVASFLATKFVVALRESLVLTWRIATLNASWLRNEPPTSAVIWAQANLHLAKRALRSSWAKIPDMVAERIKSVEEMLPTLRRIRDLRRAIELAAHERFIRRRAGLLLGGFAAQCSDPPISKEIQTKIAEGLTRLEPWSKPEEVMKFYWADVRRSVERLVEEVKPRTNDIAENEARDVVNGLVKALEDQLVKNPKDASAVPADAVEIEQQYSALELLWRNRHKERLFKKLVEEQKKSGDLDALFNAADSDAWARIKQAAENPHALRILRPSAQPQAFEQFTLTITTGDRELDDTFLFSEGLRYVWSIRLKQRYFARWWRSNILLRDRELLTPVSVEPSITQYSRWKGSATVDVVLWNGADSCKPKTTAELAIGRSEAFRVARSFEMTDVIPLGMAFVVAIATGMSTLYAGNATFGSLRDYLALFVWGAAVDQGKNLLAGSQASGQTVPSDAAQAAGTAAANPPGTPAKP